MAGSSPPLSTSARVAIWDAAREAVRAVLRGRGLAEVVTPIRLDAVAIEPWIEPIATGGGGVLATSPELPMKRLACAGATSIFQIAPVFRGGERGDAHAEEFTLLEWYRPGRALSDLERDIEAVVSAVMQAVADTLAERPGTKAWTPPEPPSRWVRHAMLDLVEATCGLRLQGDEDAEALARAAQAVSPHLVPALPRRDDDALDADVLRLAAWTGFFTAWSDHALDPWLAQQRGVGIHVVEFPAPLAALSEVAQPEHTRASIAPVGHRIESHVAGVELANGYRELRDPDEQRRRFETVQGLRAAYGLAPLPWPQAFLDDLRAPGLPALVGAALGMDRLVALAAGATRLGEVALLG